MSVLPARYFGKEIADLLGLKHTRDITIRIRYDDFVIVNVEMLLTEEDGKKLTGYLARRRYKLELIDEDEPENLLADVVETTRFGDEARTYQVVESE